MIHSELELEDFLFQLFEFPEKFTEYGLSHSDHTHRFRQISLGKYGIADLATIRYDKTHPFPDGHNKLIHVCIYELKYGAILPEAYMQIVKYATGFHEFFKRFSNCRKIRIIISATLIGREIKIKPRDFISIPGLLDFIDAYTYDDSGEEPCFNKLTEFTKNAFDCSWGKERGDQSFRKKYKNSLRSLVSAYKAEEEAIKLMGV